MMIQINRQQIQFQNNGRPMLAPTAVSPILMELLNVAIRVVESGSAIIGVMMGLPRILSFIW